MVCALRTADSLDTTTVRRPTGSGVNNRSRRCRLNPENNPWVTSAPAAIVIHNDNSTCDANSSVDAASDDHSSNATQRTAMAATTTIDNATNLRDCCRAFSETRPVLFKIKIAIGV